MTDVIAQEEPADGWEVESLYDTCFGPGRLLLSSYRLREGVDAVEPLCFVIRTDGMLSGAIRCWPVGIDGGDGPATALRVLLLGPVAIHPTRQGEGLGAALMARVLKDAPGCGWPRILLVGDAPYYKRFGFRRLEGVEMPPPTNPDRVLGWGDWTGIAGEVISATD